MSKTLVEGAELVCIAVYILRRGFSGRWGDDNCSLRLCFVVTVYTMQF
jgi:hypothetical protein